MEKIKILNIRETGLLRVGACGAAAGAINAGFCYAIAKPLPFAWHIIPAGAVHGGLLAISAFGMSRLFLKKNLGTRILAAPLVAWIGGYLSWISLSLSLTAFPLLREPWTHSLFWPFFEHWEGMLVKPAFSFGLVASLYYLFLVLYCGKKRGLGPHLIGAVVSGILGSLSFWIGFGWYFSPIHGAIWGILVGIGAWTA
jgi:hypothetical protein